MTIAMQEGVAPCPVDRAWLDEAVRRLDQAASSFEALRGAAE